MVICIRWDDEPLCGSACGAYDEPQFITTTTNTRTSSPKHMHTKTNTSTDASFFSGDSNRLLERVNSRRAADASPLAASLRAQIVDLRNRVGDSHPSIYVALNDAGRMCFEEQLHTDALNFYDEALSLQRYYLGYEHWRNADTIFGMGEVMQAQLSEHDNLNRASDYFSTALGLYDLALVQLRQQQQQQDEDEDNGEDDSNTSINNRDDEEDDGDAIMTTPKPSHITDGMVDLQCKVASSVNHLGNIRFEQRRFDEASAHYRKALTLVRAAAKQAEQALSSTGEAIEVSAPVRSATERIEFVTAQNAEGDGMGIEVSAPQSSEMVEFSSVLDSPRSVAAQPNRPRANSEHGGILHLYRQLLLQQADTLNNLANLQAERKEWADAIRHYNFALHLQIEQLGEDDSVVANTLFNLGTMNYRYGNLVGALKSYKQVVKMRKRCIGNGIEVAEGLANVAHVQMQLGDVGRSGKMYAAALRMAIADVGERHIKVGHILVGLGDLLVQHLNDTRLALEFYSDAWTIYKINELPDDHVLVLGLTKKIVDLKLDEMALGGFLSGMYEVFKSVGIDVVPVVEETNDNKLHVKALIEKMKLAEARRATAPMDMERTASF